LLCRLGQCSDPSRGERASLRPLLLQVLEYYRSKVASLAADKAQGEVREQIQKALA
jgi:hypothetical protein